MMGYALAGFATFTRIWGRDIIIIRVRITLVQELQIVAVLFYSKMLSKDFYIISRQLS
jgi:hypothetical protein